MDSNLFPTKANLMLMKRSHSIAQLGYDLMDRKRNVMVIELMQMIDKAKEIQEHIGTTFAKAYAALQQANISIGIERVNNLSYCAPIDNDVDIKFRSVMGVELPIVTTLPDEPKPIFGFVSSDSSFDNAYIRFLEVKHLTLELAEIESTIYKLAINIKKTKKRANALSDIIIPRIEGNIKYISAVFEEKEREEFTRLKVIKQQKKGHNTPKG